MDKEKEEKTLSEEDRKRIEQQLDEVFEDFYHDKTLTVRQIMFKIAEYEHKYQREQQAKDDYTDEYTKLLESQVSTLKETLDFDAACKVDLECKIKQLEAERTELRNKVIDEVKSELMSQFIFTDPKFSEINEVLNSLKK